MLSRNLLTISITACAVLGVSAASASTIPFRQSGNHGNPSTQIRIDRPDSTDIIGFGGITAGSVISGAKLEGFLTSRSFVGRVFQALALRSMLLDRLNGAGVQPRLDPPSRRPRERSRRRRSVVTDFVQAWSDGKPNYGFLILPIRLDGGILAPVGTTNGPRPVVTTPVPEPGAALLFGIGTLVVGAALPRRRRT